MNGRSRTASGSKGRGETPLSAATREEETKLRYALIYRRSMALYGHLSVKQYLRIRRRHRGKSDARLYYEALCELNRAQELEAILRCRLDMTAVCAAELYALLHALLVAKTDGAREALLHKAEERYPPRSAGDAAER